MAVAKTDEDIRALLDGVLGRRVATLQVLGINALKSLPTEVEALAGKELASVEVLPERQVRVNVGDQVLQVDLQRTGVVQLAARGGLWSRGEGSSMPTGRLLLHDGSILDFREPAKTKRISFRII